MSLVRDSQLRMLLIEGKIDEFNRQAEEEPPNLESTDLRAADLRGLDLLHADLDGANIQAARISGTRFPPSLPAAEISVTNQLGVRMRAGRS